MKNKPIGIFDSGVGGLTVVKAIKKHIPEEHIVYLGDTARVPYGGKDKETIIRYAFDSISFLRSRGAKAVIMACNTSSALALEEVRQYFPIPLLGVILPGAREALRVTRNNHIGILATEATSKSQAYTEAIKTDQSLARVLEVACPQWVDIIEADQVQTQEGQALIKSTVAPLLESQVDTVVFGCTHYPVVRPDLEAIFKDHQPRVNFVDPADQTALWAKKILVESRMVNDGSETPRTTYTVTKETPHFVKNAGLILGESIGEPELVEVAGMGRDLYGRYLSERAK